MCRPEPVSPDSPYADPGPKRLTAALSPSECQPPATDGSGRRPPSRAVARGGRPEHAERRPAGCPRWPSSSHRYRSDQRISMVLRIAAHGVPQGGAPHGRQPARTTEDRGHPRAGSVRDPGMRRSAASRTPRRRHTPRTRARHGPAPPRTTAGIRPWPSAQPGHDLPGQRDSRPGNGRDRRVRRRPASPASTAVDALTRQPSVEGSGSPALGTGAGPIVRRPPAGATTPVTAL